MCGGNKHISNKIINYLLFVEEEEDEEEEEEETVVVEIIGEQQTRK